MQSELGRPTKTTRWWKLRNFCALSAKTWFGWFFDNARSRFSLLCSFTAHNLAVWSLRLYDPKYLDLGQKSGFWEICMTFSVKLPTISLNGHSSLPMQGMVCLALSRTYQNCHGQHRVRQGVESDSCADAHRRAWSGKGLSCNSIWTVLSYHDLTDSTYSHM